MSLDDKTPPPGWWRRNVGWLAGALVLGALAFYLPYKRVVADLDKGTPRHRIEPRADGWGEYEGARWRVVRVEHQSEAGRNMADYPNPDGALVLVHYEVVPGHGPGNKPDALDICRGRLVDARGRRWDANQPAKVATLMMRQSINGRCGSRIGEDAERIFALPGKPFAFTHVYLVPPDLAPDGLRAEIILPPIRTTPHGTYLSFPLPPLR